VFISLNYPYLMELPNPESNALSLYFISWTMVLLSSEKKISFPLVHPSHQLIVASVADCLDGAWIAGLIFW